MVEGSNPGYCKSLYSFGQDKKTKAKAINVRKTNNGELINKLNNYEHVVVVEGGVDLIIL